jgi:hypothetical protein
VRQADVDARWRSDGLTTAERDKLRRLPVETRIPRMERDFLKKQPCGEAAPDRLEIEVRWSTENLGFLVPRAR